MNKYLGPFIRLVIFLLVIIFQLGFVQPLGEGMRPWINLPLILVLWSSVQKIHPWPLLAAAGIGSLLDLSTPHPFGVFLVSHVLASLTVMIISVQWLARRGTGNRVVIGAVGLLVCGFSWWIADRQLMFAPPFWSWDMLWELGLLWIGFSLFKIVRPLWTSLTKPIQRYA